MPRERKMHGANEELSAKEVLFVHHYVINGRNGGAAAKSAGYAPAYAHIQASKMLDKPRIKAAIDALVGPTFKKLEVTKERILEELALIAFSDIGEAFNANGDLLPIHDMPESIRRALSGIDVDMLFEGRGEDKEHVGFTKKIRTWEKTKAIELLGKHLKMWTDKVEVTDDRPKVVRRDLTGKKKPAGSE
ncbi:terminase small subunit [Rheinheimera sp.]|uniref:terminase small subunit n=1 Tax=Rheinheimera sp. TaxID=1869214 RepID=UPI003D278474